MSFLNANYDFNTMPFTKSDLDGSRFFWGSLLKAYHLSTPTGILKEYWDSDGSNPTSYLINLGRIIEVLFKTIDKNSYPILSKKIKYQKIYWIN
jgi:hypothetical protein